MAGSVTTMTDRQIHAALTEEARRLAVIQTGRRVRLHMALFPPGALILVPHPTGLRPAVVHIDASQLEVPDA